MEAETALESRYLYRGKILNLRVDRVLSRRWGSHP